MEQKPTIKSSIPVQLTSNRNDKSNAAITGIFFITATTFAIIGLLLYDPLLNHPDYLTQGAKNATQILWGALCELVLVIANTGTGLMLYPYLKQYNQHLGLGYICFRLLEVVFIIIGIISILALLSLSVEFTNNASHNELKTFQTFGVILKAIHDWTFILGPNFMLGINTFIYSYVFFQTKMIPRKIAILGLIGALLVFVVGNLEMLNYVPQFSVTAVIMVIPVALYEMILAVWLILKGFNFEN